MSQLSYPPDVLLVISSFLDPQFKQQLCLVSPYLHSIFAPIVLQNIRFLFCEGEHSTIPAIDEHLQTCQSDLSNLYRYAKSLRVNTQGYYIHHHVTPSLLPAFWGTIARLTALSSLELEWQRLDTEEDEDMIIEYQENILKSVLLATGDRLDQLVLKPDNGLPIAPASLKRIRGLTSLSLRPGDFAWRSYSRYGEPGQQAPPYPPWMKEVIKPLIEANPELEYLELVQDLNSGGPDPNDVLPASLTCLTSLAISGLEIPSSSSQNGLPLVQIPPLRNLRHLTVRADYKRFKIDAFWEALMAAKTPLETLVSFHICRSVMNYLASFGGLHSLEIYIEASPSPDLSSLFLQQVLPRHAESLERLVIGYDNGIYSLEGWDFDPTTWSPALAQLSHLQYLALYPPIPPNEATDSTKMTASQLTVSYQTLLDNVQDLACLETLKINLPHRNWGIGAANFRWRGRVRERLAVVVPQLRVRGGKPRELRLYSGVFRCVRLEGEVGGTEEWGYTAAER